MALKAGCRGPPLDAGWLRGDYGSRCGSRAAVRRTAAERLAAFPARRTAASELARTRGIRLFN